MRLATTIANDKRGFNRVVAARNRTNHKAECFKQFGDLFWFGHLHIIPKSFDLGNVLSTINREYELFNAYRTTSKQISATTKTNTDGITLTNDPADSPNIIEPLETIVITVAVAPTGPVTISANVAYHFVTGENLKVTFTGTRVVIASLEPQSEITETWEYFTNIIPAASGDEQRIAARDVPRQSFTYRFVKEDQDLQFFENQLWGWMQNTWGLPIWTDYTTLSADASVGATTLSVVSTDERDFRENALGGELALIWSGKNSFEAVEVESFTANSITVRQGLVNAFSEGDLVMPLRLSRITDRVGGRYWKINAKSGEVTWRVEDNRDFRDEPGSPNPTAAVGTYRGDPVWDIYDDFLQLSGATYAVVDDKDIRVFGDNLGKISASTPRKYPKNTITGLQMTSYDRTEFWRLRKFFADLRGRQKAIWVSTGREDFVPETLVAAGASEINVEPVNYTTQVRGSTYGEKTRQDIEIRYIDGTVDRFRITSSAETAGVREVLSLDGTTSQEVSVDNVDRISFLVKRRLASDTLNFQHDSYEGEVTIPFGLVDVLN